MDAILLRLKPNSIVRSPLFPEPVRVILTQPLGDDLKLIGTGLETGKTYQPILGPVQLATLEISPEQQPFDGDANRFRLGVEALRLGLAYEYDPYFALSIARIDPLPHQLEAVYHYFVKTPRIRFLLADDPGAGKTIMAGLLIQELKARGLIKRVLIVAPANLTFQWQRELRDKFRQQFEVVRGAVLRSHYGANPFQERDQVITSVSWVSRIEDARDSLMRSQWDLVIVDEAHKMSAYRVGNDGKENKTLAYQLGEALLENGRVRVIAGRGTKRFGPEFGMLQALEKEGIRFVFILDGDEPGATAAGAMSKFGAQKNRHFFQLERPDFKDKAGKSWDVEIEDMLPWPLIERFLAAYPAAAEEHYQRSGVHKVVILGKPLERDGQVFDYKMMLTEYVKQEATAANLAEFTRLIVRARKCMGLD